MAAKDRKPGKKKTSVRCQIQMCHELHHGLLWLQEKRVSQGMPHTSQSDVMNDIGLAGLRALGYKIPGDDDESK